MSYSPQDDDAQTAYPERPLYLHGPEYARHQQSRREREQQPQRPSGYVVARQREPRAYVAVGTPYGKRRQSASGEQHQRREHLGRQPADEQRIEDVADILVKQRPARTVQREHFGHAPDLHAGRGRNHAGVHQGRCQQHRHRDFRDVPYGAALKVEHDGSDHRADYHHRMQTDEPSRDKLPYRHSFPPVVVGVADHEPRQNEEEIDGQIAVVDSLIDVTCRKGFEHVKPDDHQRRYAAQSVEYVVVGFRICKCRRRDFCFRHGWLFLLLFGVNWLLQDANIRKVRFKSVMNPTFHLFCRISPASPPAFAARFAARFRRPSPPALLRPSRLHPRPRRLFPGRPLRVPALRPCPAFRPGPFPRRLLRTLPCPSPLSLPGFGSPPPRPAGPAAPVPSSHGPSGPPSSARRCSRTIPRPCTRRETPSPAVWRSAVSGR